MTTTEPELVSDQRMTKTGKRPARDVERTLTELAGVIRQQGRRPHRADAGTNDVIDAPTLAAFVAVAEAADQALREAVEHLRAQEPPTSWAEIGAVLGVSKQAAYQRFGR